MFNRFTTGTTFATDNLCGKKSLRWLWNRPILHDQNVMFYKDHETKKRKGTHRVTETNSVGGGSLHWLADYGLCFQNGEVHDYDSNDELRVNLLLRARTAYALWFLEEEKANKRERKSLVRPSYSRYIMGEFNLLVKALQQKDPDYFQRCFRMTPE